MGRSSNVQRAIVWLIGACLLVSAQTRVDYNTQVKNTPAISAAGYDTISHAFSDACAATPPKTVIIPGTISPLQTYTNSCWAPTMDFRFGTSSTPGTSRTFTTPMFGGTIYDASPATSNPLSQGDGAYAPINSFRVFESGAANAVALYSEYHATAGATGSAYGLSANVAADPGSSPGGLAHNWTVNDATHLWLSGCTRASNSATCTIDSADPVLNPPFLTGAGGVHTGSGCFFITGTSDPTFAASGNVQCGTFSNGGYTVTFPSTGANTTMSASGWISPSHQVFGFELNLNNATHDPMGLPITQGFPTPLPYWGFIATNTPFTWNNPQAGAPAVINQPITAGFFAASGGNHAQAGSQYYGFLAADAINDMYEAGWPQIGGTVSTAASGFRDRPIAIAANNTSYRSQKTCWDDSVTDGSASGHNEFTFCMWYEPISTAANATSLLRMGAPGWPTLNVSYNGHAQADSGTAADPGFSFGGWNGEGIYNNNGTLTISNGSADQVQITSSAVRVTSFVNSVNGYQTNGVTGLTIVKNLMGSNSAACTETFTGGLLTASTCP